MVEIPSTAVLADQFAKEVDFFSIGTNDLIQYTMAADRMNQRVAYLYQPYSPSILRLVKMVIDAAHAEGKWAGMCGEMAGDETAIPVLLGLGLDEFSMSATSILKARSQIKKLKKADMEMLVKEVLNMQTTSQVIEAIKATKIKLNDIVVALGCEKGNGFTYWHAYTVDADLVENCRSDKGSMKRDEGIRMSNIRAKNEGRSILKLEPENLI